ncbi:hypothetical protein J7H87_001959 [Vibrio parahaemolyticus]|nr:hypothetical protein [Vibrio parahaemolyticus]EHK0061586.1 hypothetical protein [Vibrio parahaemolyticus]
MFGFFKRKALKKRAFNLYKELVFGRLYEGNRFGLNAEDLCKTTGLNLFSTLNLIHRLIATGLVEEYELVDVVCYRAVNVPIYLDDTSPPSIINDYVKRAIGRVDFKGLA